MRKTRFIAAAAVATAFAASAGPAMAVSAPNLVTGSVLDSISIGASTPASMQLVLGGYSAPANATVTILDTTPTTAHTLTVADAGSLLAPADHVAGHMDQLVGGLLQTGSALNNPVEVSAAQDSGYQALSDSAFTAFSGVPGTLSHDVDVWYRQLVDADEPLAQADVYQLTATYTVTG